jgi:hypothetical protein
MSLEAASRANEACNAKLADKSLLMIGCIRGTKR